MFKKVKSKKKKVYEISKHPLSNLKSLNYVSYVGIFKLGPPILRIR